MKKENYCTFLYSSKVLQNTGQSDTSSNANETITGPASKSCAERKPPRPTGFPQVKGLQSTSVCFAEFMTLREFSLSLKLLSLHHPLLIVEHMGQYF